MKYTSIDEKIDSIESSLDDISYNTEKMVSLLKMLVEKIEGKIPLYTFKVEGKEQCK